MFTMLTSNDAYKENDKTIVFILRHASSFNMLHNVTVLMQAITVLESGTCSRLTKSSVSRGRSKLCNKGLTWTILYSQLVPSLAFASASMSGL